MDAWGIGALVEVCAQAFSSNQRVHVVAASPFVEKVLQLTRLDRLLDESSGSGVLFGQIVA
jgi:anti-anti-sigma regulatory factor